MLVIFENYSNYRNLTAAAAAIEPRATVISIVNPPSPVTWEDLGRQLILNIIEPEPNQLRLRRAFEDVGDEITPGRPQDGIMWPRYASFVTVP